MQLKAVIRNLAKEKQISPQLVLQNFMMERFLERVSISKYQSNFILKGGFLIATVVGIDSRTTMDIDASLKGLSINEKTVRDMFEHMCQVEVGDDITFTFRSIREIREGDEYTGFRIALTGNYPPMAVPLKLDITTGDTVTPKEINYSFRLLFEDRRISVLAYNMETVMAEKLETVISRGDQNTRPRDYYDIYILWKLQSANINMKILQQAVIATAQKRGTLTVMKNYKAIMQAVRKSDIMQNQWQRYQKSFEYAKSIDFQETCNVVLELFMSCQF